MTPAHGQSKSEEAAQTPVVSRYVRIVLFATTALASTLIALALIWSGLDSSVDRLVNSLLGRVILDGRLRLAGISAPLSEEPARLAGFAGAMGAMGWIAKRNGLPPSALELRAGGIPLAWIFGMLAGAVFAVLETVANGDPLMTVLPRIAGHGSYGTLLIMGLMWYQNTGHVFPIAGSLLIATVLHGIWNSLNVLYSGLMVAGVWLLSASAIVVLAAVAVQKKPSIFEAWSLDLQPDDHAD